MSQVISLNGTILNHIDSKASSPRCEKVKFLHDMGMVYRPKCSPSGIENEKHP